MDRVACTINGDDFLLTARYAASEPVGETWEPDLYARFKAALRPGMTVLDVGASFGLYAIAAGRAGCRVYAFEPAAASAAALRLHLEWNGAGDVTVVESAVADHSGAAVFWEQETSFVASLFEEAARGYEWQYATPVHAKRVAVVSIDDFCRDEHLWPEAIKVDVEGAEGRVLRGARRVLAECRPLIFLEVHDGEGALDELHRARYAWERLVAQGTARHYACAPAPP